MTVTIGYDLILGRLWHDALKVLSSTRHQCLKFQFEEKIVKVFADTPHQEYQINIMNNVPYIRDKVGIMDPPSLRNHPITITDVNLSWGFSKENILT